MDFIDEQIRKELTLNGRILREGLLYKEDYYRLREKLLREYCERRSVPLKDAVKKNH